MRGCSASKKLIGAASGLMALSVLDISTALASPAAIYAGASGGTILTVLLLLSLGTALVWFYYDDQRRQRMDMIMAQLDADKLLKSSEPSERPAETPAAAPVAQMTELVDIEEEDDSDFGPLSTQELKELVIENMTDVQAVPVASPPPVPGSRSPKPAAPVASRSLPRLTERLGRAAPSPLERLLSRPVVKAAPTGLDEDTLVDPLPRPRRRLGSGTGPQKPQRPLSGAAARRRQAAGSTCATPRSKAGRPRVAPKPLPPPPAKRTAPGSTPKPAAAKG